MPDKHITQMTIEEFATHVDQGISAYAAMASDTSSDLYKAIRQATSYLSLIAFGRDLSRIELTTMAFALGMLCEREGWYIPDESLQPPAEQKPG